MSVSYKVCLTLAAVLVLLSPPAIHAQDANKYKNLQVLPKDISQGALSDKMIENLLGLGLPRRQSEGCLHCHVGDMEIPTESWDFASDAKRAKRNAREMMRMVAAINDTHLASLEERFHPNMRVTCMTCHAGRLDPRPLPDVLWSEWNSNGVQGAIDRYRELRERFFAADAYDFRVGVLSRLAGRLVEAEAFDDAVAIAALEAEIHGDDAAQQAWLFARLQRTAAQEGIPPALAELEKMVKENSPESTGLDLLDSLGWWLYRQEKRDEALIVFRHNLTRFPDEYIPQESLADALWFNDEPEQALALFEDWLERHPDHTMARRRLTNLRTQR